jgi:hypothetical protein
MYGLHSIGKGRGLLRFRMLTMEKGPTIKKTSAGAYCPRDEIQTRIPRYHPASIPDPS